MTTIVGPDGSSFEFPDDIHPDIVKQAMQRHYGGSAAMPASAPEALSGAPATQQPPAATLAPQERIPELTAREPDLPERLSGLLGGSSQYWRGAGHNLSAPARILEGAEAPYKGALQGILHAGEYATSLGGYAPNAVSEGIGSASRAYDYTLGRGEEQRQQERAAVGVDPNSTDYSHAIGTVVSPLNATTARAVTGVLGEGTNWLARAWRAGVLGGAIGAEQPVYSSDYAGEKAAQAATGAAVGAGAETLASGVAPWMTQQARALYERYGIRVPFLTSLGRLPARVEQISQSVPGSGMMVRGAYETANEDLVRAATNEALAPLEPYGFGQRYAPGSATRPGRDMARERGDAISASYNAVIPRLRGQIDPQLQQDIQAIRARLPARVRDDFDDAMNRHLFSKAAGPAPGQPLGSLNGRDAKFADMDLRDEASSRIQNPSSTNDRYLGEGIGEARAALRDMWARHSAPEDIAQLQATDDAYGLHKILEKAATSSASSEGVFGPTQLWQAVKSQDATLGKRALDRGEARLQDLAETARTVLGKTVADSGTPERAALMALAHGTAVTGIGAISPPMLAGLATHAAAYTGPGQTALRTLAEVGGPFRQGLAEAVRRAIPGAAAISENGGTPPTGVEALSRLYSPPAQNVLSKLASGAPASPQEITASAQELTPGVTALVAHQAPYSNTPKTQREWQAEYQRRIAQAQRASAYYGQ